VDFFATTTVTGLGVGLMATALLLGMRHGVDWDHIAAITDLSAAQESPRRGVVLGTLYALGHGVVVLVIGTVAIVAGRNLPESIDALFGRIVGWSLIILGVYVVWSLAVHRGGFRMQSRWMLLIRGVRRVVARFSTPEPISHSHPHAAMEGVHHDGDESPGHDRGVHDHPHVHRGVLTDDITPAASVGVGMLHGVGAETPTQVLIFLAAAQAGGMGAGMLVLVVFLMGVLMSNTLIVLLSVYGFRSARRRRRIQVGLGVVTAAVSLVVGALFASGNEAVLPDFFTG
jgi:high-affinity nickel permease